MCAGDFIRINNPGYLFTLLFGIYTKGLNKKIKDIIDEYFKNS